MVLVRTGTYKTARPVTVCSTGNTRKTCTWTVNVILITFYSSSSLGQETAKGPFGLWVKLPPAQWCRSLLSIGGDNLQFYPNFTLFSTLGGWTSTTILFRCGNLVKTKRKMQIEHFFSPNSGKDQKKRSSARIEHFFPQIYAQLYTHLNYWGRCNYWGGYSQIIGGISPPGFGTPAPAHLSTTRRRLHTVPLIAERQAGKLWIPIFIVFCLIRPGIEPRSTDSVADALSTRPMYLCTLICTGEKRPSCNTRHLSV